MVQGRPGARNFDELLPSHQRPLLPTRTIPQAERARGRCSSYPALTRRSTPEETRQSHRPTATSAPHHSGLSKRRMSAPTALDGSPPPARRMFQAREIRPIMPLHRRRQSRHPRHLRRRTEPARHEPPVTKRPIHSARHFPEPTHECSPRIHPRLQRSRHPRRIRSTRLGASRCTSSQLTANPWVGSRSRSTKVRWIAAAW